MAREQVETALTTIDEIMKSKAFERGFDEQRAGRKPRYDEEHGNASWNYERGRQFAIIAPASMQLRLPGSRRLNPKAAEFACSSGVLGLRGDIL
jgi:hypothetical protein